MSGGLRVLCIGSPFDGDQLGYWAYRQLCEVLPAVELHYLDRPGARLLAALQGAEKVILVDAVKTGAAAGSLHRFEGEAIYRQLQRHTSTHGFGVADALQLAARLGELPPRVVLHGMELGTDETALVPLLAAVVKEIQEETQCAG